MRGRRSSLGARAATTGDSPGVVRSGLGVTVRDNCHSFGRAEPVL
jgi:hypothetical protein